MYNLDNLQEDIAPTGIGEILSYEGMSIFAEPLPIIDTVPMGGIEMEASVRSVENGTDYWSELEILEQAEQDRLYDEFLEGGLV